MKNEFDKFQKFLTGEKKKKKNVHHDQKKKGDAGTIHERTQDDDVHKYWAIDSSYHSDSCSILYDSGVRQFCGLPCLWVSPRRLCRSTSFYWLIQYYSGTWYRDTRPKNRERPTYCCCAWYNSFQISEWGANQNGDNSGEICLEKNKWPFLFF